MRGWSFLLTFTLVFFLFVTILSFWNEFLCFFLFSLFNNYYLFRLFHKEIWRWIAVFVSRKIAWFLGNLCEPTAFIDLVSLIFIHSNFATFRWVLSIVILLNRWTLLFFILKSLVFNLRFLVLEIMSLCISNNLGCLYERVPIKCLVDIVSLFNWAFTQRCIKGIIVLEITAAPIDFVRLGSWIV